MRAPAILLLARKAGLGEFTDEVALRPDVQAMIQRINFYVHPEAEAAGFDKMTSLLRIHLKDGRVISGRAEFTKGEFVGRWCEVGSGLSMPFASLSGCGFISGRER
jgi:2-methylcitrate dehydratase PrpD